MLLLYIFYLYIYCFSLFFVFQCILKFGHIFTLEHLELSNVLNYTLNHLWMYHKLCNQIPTNGYETVSKFSVLPTILLRTSLTQIFTCMLKRMINSNNWVFVKFNSYRHKKALSIHFHWEFVRLYLSYHIINNTEYYQTFKISNIHKNSYFNCTSDN